MRQQATAGSASTRPRAGLGYSFFWLAAALAGLLASCRTSPFVIVDGDADAGQQAGGSAGAPTDAVCSPGDFRCDGAALQGCADDGLSFLTVQTCESASLCQESPAGCGGAACLADEMTCQDDLLMLCNAERTGFEIFDTCQSAAHCSSAARRCLEVPCTAGQARCNREVDGSTALQRCSEDGAWEMLEICVTRQLCDQSMTDAAAGRLNLRADGAITLVVDQSEVSACGQPRCQPREVQCDGANLVVCNPGQTGFDLLEECASVDLCQQSVSNTNAVGAASCVEPICDAGSFTCTETGVLQICEESRTSFRTVQACSGPAFCDSAGGACTEVPCEAGAERCNGNRPERCRDDRTGFDDLGIACETASLCNDDGEAAFCEDPLCRRGNLSPLEYDCEQATLLRCRDSLDDYEAVAQCATPALCSKQARGCLEPVCDPEEFRCSGVFLQVCNADQTDFEPVENCGAPSQCDATQGTCTDPCEPGAVRCTPRGELERCEDRLTGWQIFADCVTPELCNAEAAECGPVVCDPGQRRCGSEGQRERVEQCAAGRDGYDTLVQCDAGETCDAQNSECDVCEASSVRCEGDTLVTCSNDGQRESRQQCGAGLCSAQARRCLACDPIGSARCQGAQLLVCTQGNQGEFERSELCETGPLCQQTLSQCGSDGGACQCSDRECLPGEVRCSGNTLEQCNAGRTAFERVASCGPGLCDQGSGQCDVCFAGQLSCDQNGNLRQCSQDGQRFVGQPTPARCDGNTLRLCQNGQVQQSNCQPGLCNAGARRCDQCSGNGFLRCDGNVEVRCSGGFESRTSCTEGCNQQRGSCNECSGNETRCLNGNTRQRCAGGVFVNEPCPNGCNQQRGECNQCAEGSTTCLNGNQRQFCQNGLRQTQNCQDGCVNNACASCGGDQCQGPQIRRCQGGQLQGPTNCPNGQTCSNDQCVAQLCTPNQSFCGPGGNRRVCNADGTGSALAENCPNGCEGGQCVPVCTPNESFCGQGGNRRQCNADGTASALAELCPNGCDSGACI